MEPTREASVDVFADYHQFYLWDAGTNPVAPEDWSDRDVANRAKVAEHVLVVCPIRDMTVPVRVSLYSAEPALDPGRYEHIVQAALALPTGQFQMHESTGGEVLGWKVEPGIYRVLVLFAGLSTISSDEMDGQDSYSIALWPGERRPLEVVKAWPKR